MAELNATWMTMMRNYPLQREDVGKEILYDSKPIKGPLSRMTKEYRLSHLRVNHLSAHGVITHGDHVERLNETIGWQELFGENVTPKDTYPHVGLGVKETQR